MMSANRQQLRMQCVDVVDCRQIWSGGKSRRCVTLSGYQRSRTFHCLSDPISFDMCRSGTVLSGTSSNMISGVGAGGN